MGQDIAGDYGVGVLKLAPQDSTLECNFKGNS